MADITLDGRPFHTSGELPVVGSRAPDFRLVASDLVPELPRYLPDPNVTLVYRHPACIADLFPDGKREKKDGAIWITYEPPERLRRVRNPSSGCRGGRRRRASRPSRLPEQ